MYKSDDEVIQVGRSDSDEWKERLSQLVTTAQNKIVSRLETAYAVSRGPFNSNVRPPPYTLTTELDDLECGDTGELETVVMEGG